MASKPVIVHGQADSFNELDQFDQHIIGVVEEGDFHLQTPEAFSSMVVR
ncbi:MAG: hypothetical protein JJE28_08425 [Actinomycetales bacterium]|nr:hypothetical protein [Actinomycetales bacterium]